MKSFEFRKLIQETLNEVLKENQLDEMAKIAGDLKSAIEKVIQDNPDLDGLPLKKAIKADSDVQSALAGDDLYDNQLNKFIALTKGERELGQRGRKPGSDSDTPKAPREPGAETRGRKGYAPLSDEQEQEKQELLNTLSDKLKAGIDISISDDPQILDAKNRLYSLIGKVATTKLLTAAMERKRGRKPGSGNASTNIVSSTKKLGGSESLNDFFVNMTSKKKEVLDNVVLALDMLQKGTPLSDEELKNAISSLSPFYKGTKADLLQTLSDLSTDEKAMKAIQSKVINTDRPDKTKSYVKPDEINPTINKLSTQQKDLEKELADVMSKIKANANKAGIAKMKDPNTSSEEKDQIKKKIISLNKELTTRKNDLENKLSRIEQDLVDVSAGQMDTFGFED
jgi:hypothetical protein